MSDSSSCSTRPETHQLGTTVGEDVSNVPLEYFLGSVVPRVPPDKLRKIMNELGTSAKDGRMNGFNVDPKSARVQEVMISQGLHDFSIKLLDVAREEMGATEKLVPCFNANHSPQPQRSNASHPDAYWRLPDVLCNSQEKDGWEDTVVAQEFEPDESARDDDNCRKIMWSTQQILRNDPRRYFTFGITIENTSCRFWFFSRSHIMVSHHFDLITDSRYYVEFLIGLSFAHILQVDIPTTLDVNRPLEIHGYDPTIDLLEPGKYVICVGGKTYETCGVLSDFRTERICGRCTRVWEVHEKGVPDTTYVLKDVWVDARNKTEPEIWDELKAVVDHEIFERHFLTLVDRMSPNEVVTTCQFLRRGAHSLRDTPSQTVAVCETQEHTSVDPPHHSMYTPRKHDRSVWRQVCTPYENLTTVPLMMKTLEHAVIALQALWKDAKAVHRDLSPGNVFYDEKCNVGRLGDLEYVMFCLETDGSESHNTHVGTPEFMAAEVASGGYLFAKTTSTILSLPLISADMLLEDSDDDASENIPISSPRHSIPTFTHNPIHDLESIWWLLIWTIHRYYPNPPPPTLDHTNLTTQIEAYRNLFPGTSTARRVALTSGSGIHPDSIAPFSLLQDRIELIRRCLYGHYLKVEETFPLVLEAFDDIHTPVIHSLHVMGRKVSGAQINKVVKASDLLRDIEPPGDGVD